MHRAIEPIGLARNDYDICRDLAQCLGVENAFSEGRDEMEWISHLYDLTREDAQRRFNHSMPSFDEFWEIGYAQVPTRPNFTYLESYRENPEERPLRTESGRIVLFSEELQQLKLDDCPPHPAWLEPAEWLGSAATSHQFHLLSRQPKGKLHSQLDHAPVSMAHKRAGKEQILLHPEDAARLGIESDDVVRVWNARGQCLASASVDEIVRPGVAILPTGSWYDPEDESSYPLERAGNPNTLTLDKGSSAFGQGCSAHTCLVSIERYKSQGA